MKEPINHSKASSPFIGKSYNKHPQWYNVPLRLNDEQRHEPEAVLQEFFQCFHLNEIRELLWAWMVEVVSSPHGIAHDHHERSNHIYFYEKMEEVVEAVFMINKRVQKIKARQARRKGKREISH